jgi:hypothetical protein
MFDLKELSREGIPRALERVERYRLLNEPEQAESMCLDILQADPANQEALVGLLLSLTDQFCNGMAARLSEARAVVPRLQDDYSRSYYAGIICERRARAQLQQGAPGGKFTAYDGLREAMSWYEKAERIRPAGNDDAILRWNTCARTIMKHRLEPRPHEMVEHPLE